MKPTSARSMTSMFAASVFAVQMTLSGTAGAATIYVPDDYGKIADACRAAHSGDTIIVRNGTYYESLWDLIPNGIDDGHRTTLKAENRGGAKIYGSNVLIALFSGQYITIDGLVLEAPKDKVGNQLEFYKNGAGDPTHHVTIQYCEMLGGKDTKSPNSSWAIGGGGDSMKFSNNVIHDIGWTYPGDPDGGTGNRAYAMYTIPLTNSIVENNTIYHCSGWGLHLWTGTFENNVFRGNVIHDNGYQGVILYTNGSGNKFYKNIFYNNGLNGNNASTWGGLRVKASGTEIYNNTFYGNRGPGIDLAGGSSITARNNTSWSNKEGGIVNSAATNPTIDHNLTETDPLFVDAAGADFHLRAGSPAIDTGVVIPGLAYEGPAPDIGALESSAVGGSPSPPSNLRIR